MRDDSREILFWPFLREAIMSSYSICRGIPSLMLSIQHFLCWPRHCYPPGCHEGWLWRGCHGMWHARIMWVSISWHLSRESPEGSHGSWLYNRWQPFLYTNCWAPPLMVWFFGSHEKYEYVMMSVHDKCWVGWLDDCTVRQKLEHCNFLRCYKCDKWENLQIVLPIELYLFTHLSVTMTIFKVIMSVLNEHFIFLFS